LSSSKCKWRHCRLQNVNEGIVAFWIHCCLWNVKKQMTLIVSARQKTMIVLKTTKADDHDCLCMPTDLMSLEGKEDYNSLENNKSGWPWLSPHANGFDLSLEGKEDFNSLGRKTLKSSKRGRWPWLSLHANRLDCLWKAKKTIIVLKTTKANDHDCLRMPTDLIVSGRQRRL